MAEYGKACLKDCYLPKCLFQIMNGMIEKMKQEVGTRYAAQKPTYFSRSVVAIEESAAMLIILFILAG